MVTGDSAGGGLTVSSALEVSHRVFYLDQTLYQKVPLKAIVPVYPATVQKRPISTKIGNFRLKSTKRSKCRFCSELKILNKKHTFFRPKVEYFLPWLKKSKKGIFGQIHHFRPKSKELKYKFSFELKAFDQILYLFSSKLATFLMFSKTSKLLIWNNVFLVKNGHFRPKLLFSNRFQLVKAYISIQILI